MQDGGPVPAGASGAERLDPFALPIRFAVSDTAADQRVRYVELTRERVVVRRAVRGIKMAVRVPVAAYLGVAIRMQPPEGDRPGTVSIMLEHRDPGLSLPLYCATHGNDVVAEWQSWARVLDRPLLVTETDGRLREPFAHIGAVIVAPSTARRRQRNVIRRRRPKLPLRRRAGTMPTVPLVHRGEHEIIARN
jgi:hypothetical protein